MRLTKDQLNYTVDNAIANYLAGGAPFGFAPLYYLAKAKLVNIEYDRSKGCGYNHIHRTLGLCSTCGERYAKYLPRTTEKFIEMCGDYVNRVDISGDFFSGIFPEHSPYAFTENWLATARRVFSEPQIKDMLTQTALVYEVKHVTAEARYLPAMWLFNYANAEQPDGTMLPNMIIDSYEIVKFAFWGSLIGTKLYELDNETARFGC